MLGRLLGNFYAPSARSRMLAAGLVALCQLGIAWFGLVVAVAGGVLLGPYMPLDTITGEAQKLSATGCTGPPSSAWWEVSSALAHCASSSTDWTG